MLISEKEFTGIRFKIRFKKYWFIYKKLIDSDSNI